MKATELIETSLQMSRGWLSTLVEDMKGLPTTYPTAAGGNHPLWVLGHVVHSEAALRDGFILGTSCALSKWDELFGRGSQADADAGKYPGMDELFAEWERVRSRTLTVLHTLTDGDLSRQSHAPADMAAMFGTVGQCFAMISHHAIFHAGQVADARRSAGRPPLFG